MKKQCSFLIVCFSLLAACTAPRQVALDVPVTIRDTIYVAAPVLPTESTATEVFSDLNPVDSFTVQDSFAWATVVMVHDTIVKTRTYKVNFGRKVDTVYIEYPVVLHDTIQVECPPTLPAMSEDGKFPWWWILASLGALSLWWVGKRKAKE